MADKSPPNIPPCIFVQEAGRLDSGPRFDLEEVTKYQELVAENERLQRSQRFGRYARELGGLLGADVKIGDGKVFPDNVLYFEVGDQEKADKIAGGLVDIADSHGISRQHLLIGKSTESSGAIRFVAFNADSIEKYDTSHANSLLTKLAEVKDKLQAAVKLEVLPAPVEMAAPVSAPSEKPEVTSFIAPLPATAVREPTIIERINNVIELTAGEINAVLSALGPASAMAAQTPAASTQPAAEAPKPPSEAVKANQNNATAQAVGQ